MQRSSEQRCGCQQNLDGWVCPCIVCQQGLALLSRRCAASASGVACCPPASACCTVDPPPADSAPKGGPKGPGRQFIEDTYLQRKRRRERYK